MKRERNLRNQENMTRKEQLEINRLYLIATIMYPPVGYKILAVIMYITLILIFGWKITLATWVVLELAAYAVLESKLRKLDNMIKKCK